MLSRRKARENAFIALFTSSFGDEIDNIIATFGEDEQEFAVDDFGKSLLKHYEENAVGIDQQIEQHLKGWKVKRLQKVNLAILRLSVAEILYGEPGMDSIVINEAVELAKRYGDDNDYQFINGVLGSISREKDTPVPESDS